MFMCMVVLVCVCMIFVFACVYLCVRMYVHAGLCVKQLLERRGNSPSSMKRHMSHRSGGFEMVTTLEMIITTLTSTVYVPRSL